jgi:NADH:ubiquinone oxidoreductase subunit 6 (subunit J)
MLLTITLFFIFTTLSILSSVFVVFSRNLIIQILFLIFSFFNVSCILFLFNFEFLPVSVLVIYTGIFIAFLCNFYIKFVFDSIDKNSVIYCICLAFLGMSVLLFNCNIEAYCGGSESDALMERSCENKDKYS